MSFSVLRSKPADFIVTLKNVDAVRRVRKVLTDNKNDILSGMKNHPYLVEFLDVSFYLRRPEDYEGLCKLLDGKLWLQAYTP